MRGRAAESYYEEWLNDQITQGAGELMPWFSPDSLRVIVNAYIDKGVDFVKIGVTAHSQTDPALVFSQRQMNAIVEAIHKRGLMAEVHSRQQPFGTHLAGPGERTRWTRRRGRWWQRPFSRPAVRASQVAQAAGHRQDDHELHRRRMRDGLWAIGYGLLAISRTASRCYQ
jgi:hypothetical protein